MKIPIPFTNWSIEIFSIGKAPREERKRYYRSRDPLTYINMEIEDIKKSIEEIRTYIEKDPIKLINIHFENLRKDMEVVKEYLNIERKELLNHMHIPKFCSNCGSRNLDNDCDTYTCNDCLFKFQKVVI